MNQPRRRRNVAKLLARLNPKGMPAEPSPGHGTSMPLETAIDIAGALGAAGQGGAGPRLAVLALCLRWWPGMFEGPSRPVAYRLVHHNPKWHKLLDLPKTEFTSACCERIPIEVPAETQAFRIVASLLEHRMRRHVMHLQARAQTTIADELAKAAAVMTIAHVAAIRDLATLDRASSPEFLGDWSRVVIHEYRHPNHCPTCTPWGKAGEVPRTVEENGKVVRVEWRTCEICLGAAVLAWGSKRRAKALRIGEHPFRNLLSPIHEGALSLLRELEWRGARLLVKRLGLADER